MAKIKNGFIGIDLGTTNSCIATAYYTASGKVEYETLPIAQKCATEIVKSDILPSYIYIRKNGDMLIGEGAKREDVKTRSATGEVRALRVFKRDMGRDNVTYVIGDQIFNPVSASSIILGECGRAYNGYHKNRDSIRFEETPTTITCPACFEKDAIEDTQRAAKRAGFDIQPNMLRMLPEPTAALLFYVYTETDRSFLDLSKTKRFIVVDIGGGTCDVVIIDVRNEVLPTGKSNLIFHPIGTPNRGDLGGSDFDRLLARAMLIWFLKENNLDIDPKSKEYEKMINLLFIWAEKAKEALSNNLSYLVEQREDINIFKPGALKSLISELDSYPIQIDNLYNGIPFYYELTMEEYLQIVERLIIKTKKSYQTIEEKIANKNLEEIISDTLKDSGCDKKSIDYVFFTGGMSLFLPLQVKLFEIFGKDVKRTEEPLSAVAKGAALYTLFKEAEIYNENLPKVTADAYQLRAAERALRENKQRILMPTSIGKTYMIEKRDQIPFILIDKNKEYPVPRTRIDSTFKTQSETGVIINIFTGTSQYDSDLEKARSQILEFPVPKELETEFWIDYEINDSGSPIFHIVFSDTEEYTLGGVENE